MGIEYQNLILYFVAGFQPIPYLVVLYHLIKAPYVYPTVKLMWALGFIFCLSDIGLCTLIAFPKLYYKSGYFQIIVWLAISLFGVYHWLFSLEYYYSSKQILNKLSGNLPAVSEMYRKWVIFWTVTFVFCLLEAVCCYFQVKIVKRDAREGLVGENELPDVLMVLLDLGSSILLIVSIQRFRKISNQNPGLEESKTAIFLHLTLFSIETLFIIGFVTF
jgi:hypothetical protein